MSKNTVKDRLTPRPAARRSRRARRSVENTEFDGFVRRVLAAYGRRVADGDVEALKGLAALSSEVDAITRLAVAGLKRAPYGYSWAEIADRLGVTRQGAQMRYGDRSDRGALDRRLVEAGLRVSVPTLVAVFADHHPGNPAGSVCPGCGYRYPNDGPSECPTLATVRPVLYRRRSENPTALDRLTPDQFADLHHIKTARNLRTALVQAARPAPAPVQAASLLDLIDATEPAR